jgi:DNA polymerase-4/DNA polymerase V
VLAKVASKWNKPAGLTTIAGREIHSYLEKMPVGKVWNIGPSTAAYLNKHHIYTALEFAQQSEGWVKHHFNKPILEVWHELNGRSVYPVLCDAGEGHHSISKTKTFTPPSCHREYVYAQLTANVENACIKARRYNLAAKSLYIYLKTQDFVGAGAELRLTRATSHAPELLLFLRGAFEALFRENVPYRATGVVLTRLQPQVQQFSLFEEAVQLERQRLIDNAVDEIARRFGKHTILLGCSLPAKAQEQHDGARGAIPWRKQNLLPGETQRQRLGIIRLDAEI